jgi:uncharacterized LabA/DUF88 family protein
MSREPAFRRAFAFIDASNTRASARRAFGDAFGNFNPVALAEEVCTAQGWTLAGVAYYLGVPDVRVTEDGHYTWIKRCARWRKQGVRVFTRTLLHDDEGVPREKGIDVRIALDAVSLFRQNAYDVALVFSQDQDFSELAAELKSIGREEKRDVHVVSAFPTSEKAPAVTGVSGMAPVPLDEALFKTVLDTPENRRRIHTPLVVPPPGGKRAPPAPVIESRLARAAAIADGAPIALAPSPPAITQKSPVKGRIAFLISAYLAIAAVTFGYLTWTTRDALADPSARWPSLAAHARVAMIWPAYWLGNEHIRQLKDGIPKIAYRDLGL